MSGGTLAYESVLLHPGRFRIHESAEALEIELVPRPAWGKLPWIVLIWFGAAAFCLVMWWLRASITVPLRTTVPAELIWVTFPFGAIFATFVLIWRDLQRLILRVGAGGVTLIRYTWGQPDRQRLGLMDVLIAIDPDMPSTIRFITRIGGEVVQVARKPEFVAEICALLARRLDLERQRAAPDARGLIM